MSKIQEDLKSWAKEAYDFYLPKAKPDCLNMDFYTQSDLSLLSDDKPVELMVVAINPGGGGSFLPERFTCHEDLLKGNICGGKHVNIQKMKIIKNLRSILENSDLDSDLSQLLNDESTFVFTNATFFTTHKEDELKGDIIKESIAYTRKLIDIVKPKHIICLGGEKCVELLLDNSIPLLNNVVKLEYGLIGKIPVYGINHTSGYHWSDEEKELVGKALKRAFEIDKEPIDSKAFEIELKADVETFKQKRNDRENIKLEGSLRWQYIYVSLCNHCEYQLGLEIYEKDCAKTRFYIKNQEGTNILTLSIVNQSDKYIGIRYIQENCPKKDNFEDIVSKLQKIDKFRSSVKDNGNVTWIGCLNWSNQVKNTDDFITEAKKLLTNIVESLSELS